ncbi:MAG: T9SS type A sorting domain-containing protein [Bacteroidota bacterium]|nr:T9SS type A sorting domain-containing protein [Bacteroidota bacterium]
MPNSSSQRNPNAAEIEFSSGNKSSKYSIAAWERQKDGVWNIYYSRLIDGDSLWSESKPLTHDTIDNTNIQIRPISDSTCIIVWKRKSFLLYAFVNPISISAPETLAVGNSDSLEYDISVRANYGSIVWTSRDTANKNIMIFQSFTKNWNSPFTLSNPETLFFWQNVFSPKLIINSSAKTVLFETIFTNKRELLLWEGYRGGASENISNDSLADDCNAQAYISDVPIVYTNSSRRFPFYSFFVIEKHTKTDSVLVFLRKDYMSDTVKSKGYNRNACIGSHTYFSGSNQNILTVWESNRSGKSHIYSRMVSLQLNGVQKEIFKLSPFKISQNYPNPFNPTTVINYQLSVNSFVILKVYDMLGREAVTLVNETKKAGDYSVQWNASAFASGIYFYQLEANERREMKKMVLLK